MSILSRIFQRKPRHHFPQSEQVIEYAFTSGGVDYYQHVDEMNMPYGRALKALAFYAEFNMKMDADFIKKWVSAFDAVLNAQKFNIDSIVELKKLVHQIKERQAITFMPDHIYKLASVRYFDKHENPNDYDYAYNAKKIEKWKKEPVNDFFLSEPIVKLVPFLKDAPAGFETFIQAVSEMESQHLAFVSEIL